MSPDFTSHLGAIVSIGGLAAVVLWGLGEAYARRKSARR